MKTRAKYLLFILVVGSLICLFNLAGRDLWDPDETRYAVVAREMRETGQWVLPHLNETIYAEKPPLFFWVVNLSVFFLGKDSELTNRLPSALAGLLTILLTFFLGERLFNSRVGLLSAIVLTSCLFFPQLSRWMMLDSLFTLLFLLTLCCFYLGYEKEEGRRRYYFLAGLLMGLGVLTKGPIAYLTLPIFLILAFLQRGVRKFLSYELLFGFLLSLAIVLAWLIPACLVGGEAYARRIVLQQMVGRLAGNMTHFHPEPFFFYFPRFSVEFLPWVVFLPTAFVFALRREEAPRRKELLFLSVWFILVFVFFTFVKGKKDNYIIPLYPAAAILLGWFWDKLILSQGKEKGVIAGLLLLTCLVLVAFVLFIVGFPEKRYPVVAPYRFLVFFILSYLLIGLSASFFCFVSRKKMASFMCLVVTFGILHLHISYALPTKLNATKSMRGFSEKILKRMEAGDELKSCFFLFPGLIYYTGRPVIEEIKTDKQFLEILRSPQRVFLVIKTRELNRIKRDLKIEIEPIEEEKVGSFNLALISNRRE